MATDQVPAATAPPPAPAAHHGTVDVTAAQFALLYAAWLKAYPAGTPEGDVARSRIPTEAGTPEPTALPIYSATPQAGRVVAIVYANEGGAHATTLELLCQLPGEPDFGHSTPVQLGGQLVGPFPPNTLVGLRTRVSNSHAGFVLGDIVQVLIPA